MAYRSNDVIRLESEFVDKYGITRVLEMLAGICDEKADHIKTNYGDTILAGRWKRKADIIDIAAQKVSE